jgi:NADH-quinone oxidoreductase subunit M
MPNLAILFLITGLASVGFPGTIGFVSTELLVDGVIHVYPLSGLAMVAAAAINGISIVGVYFRLFTGTRHTSTISLQSRWPERLAVLTLVALMIGGGLYPQPFLASRQHAAEHLIEVRNAQLNLPSHPGGHAYHSEMPAESEKEFEDVDDVVAVRGTQGWGRSVRVAQDRAMSMADVPRMRERGPHRNRDAMDEH